MNNKFTPGPWKWDGISLVPVNPNPERQAIHTIVELGEWSGTGYVQAKLDDCRAEDERNLLLLQHAPDLFGALERLTLALHTQEGRKDLPGALLKAMDTLAAAAPGWGNL